MPDVPELEVTEEILWKKIQLLLDALDTILTTHADSCTLKEIARQALNHILEDE